MWKEIKRDTYTLDFDEPTIFVDNKAKKRSGHMSHAMVPIGENKMLDFYSNCSAVRSSGHSVYGWIEYKISEDNGETYGEEIEFPYSKQAFLDGEFIVSVEKAVTCDNGNIVAFCLRNLGKLCMPWDTPTAIISNDGGKTWAKPIEVSTYKGRIYDALYHEGVIYVLQFCNDGEETWLGKNEEHVYRIFVSRDNGLSFEEMCIVPFESTIRRGYGAMLFDYEGNLHVYAYHVDAEHDMDHIVSRDVGKTFEKSDTCYLEKGMRNPQIEKIDGVYIMHGRAEKETGFVIYSSLDAVNWDEGEYLAEVKGLCYYSNNVVLKSPDGGNRLLIQYSEKFEADTNCVNIKHVFMRVKRSER